MSKNYEAIMDIFSDVVEDAEYSVALDWGEPSDVNIFNTEKDKTLLWITPPQGSWQFINYLRLNKVYAVTMYAYQPDDADSNNIQRLGIIQDVDAIVTEFFLDMNQLIWNMPDADKRPITISDINIDSFFKQTVHVLTGLIVTFKLTVPDDFDYCPTLVTPSIVSAVITFASVEDPAPTHWIIVFDKAMNIASTAGWRFKQGTGGLFPYIIPLSVSGSGTTILTFVTSEIVTPGQVLWYFYDENAGNTFGVDGSKFNTALDNLTNNVV